MKKWIYFILVLLSFVLYGNSILNDYSLDDDFVVSNNPNVQKGIAGIPDIFTNRYSVNKDMVLDYRPVVLISFALEYQFFKQSPQVSHLINILLYAMCLLVLYDILISVFGLHKINIWLPFIITVFYGVHPIHTEVVNSLKNRDELFCFLFGMLFLKNGYLFFSSSSNRKKYALLTVLFFVLTLFSKIVGILYIVVLFLILLYNNLLRWNKYNYLFVFMCFLIWLFSMSKIFSGLKRNTLFIENSLVGDPGVLLSIATALKIIFYHLKMLLISFPFRFYYGYNLFPVEHLYEPVIIISLVIHLWLLIAGIRFFRKKDITGLFILCYLGCLLLYSNFPIPYTGMFSERALFLSSLWFIAFVFLLVLKATNYLETGINFTGTKKLVIFLLLFIFIIYSLKTIRRNYDWKDTITLMSHDIPYMENSALGNYIFANNLLKESRITKDSAYAKYLAEKGVTYYRKTIELFPYYPDFHYRLAKTFQEDIGNLNSAEFYYKNVLRLDSTFMDVRSLLGKLYFEKKDYKNSYENFSESYNKNPADSITLFYLSENANAVGDLETVYKINKEFIKLFPKVIYPYMNLGVYYSKMLKDDTAVIYFKKAVELGERNPQLLNQLSIYYFNKNDKSESQYYRDLLNSK